MKPVSESNLMYTLVKKLVLKILKVPPEPEDPMGDVESLLVFRASPNFFKYKLIVWGVKNLFAVLFYILIGGILLADLISSKSFGALALIETFIFGILLLFYPIQLFISYVVLRLDYEMRWYKVSDRSLRIREGVVFVREMTMTFANIQNISISQGPIQRLLKIADLRVETAGGGGMTAENNDQHNIFSMHVGFFRGVDNCEGIRDMMFERLKKIKSTGLGDNDDEADEAEIKPGIGLIADANFIRALSVIRDEVIQLRVAAEKV